MDEQPRVTFGLSELLKRDPFRFTRTDAEIAAMVHHAKQITDNPYCYLMNALIGTSGSFLEEPTAEMMWLEIMAHRGELTSRIGRDLPLRAAAIDWLYLHDESKRPMHVVVVARSTLESALEEGRTDPLTGLLLKSPFERAVANLLRRQPVQGGCLVYVDLDGFKQVNDRLGHAAGDLILQTFARVARAGLRKDDIIGRLGGDEFALLLAGVEVVATQRIVERVRTLFEQETADARVSFSYGIAELSRADTPADVMSRADVEMYRQKRLRKLQRGDAPP